MKRSKIEEEELEYCLTINVQLAKRRFIFFLSLVAALGSITIFYNMDPNYAFDAMGIFSWFAVLLGVLLYMGKIKSIKLVGFVLCSSIFAHSVAHLTELFYESHPDTIGILITSLVWFAFGFSFSTNWNLLIEPYFIGFHYFELEKSVPCLGCKKKKKG